MNIQKTALGTLAGFVGIFGLGYVIYVLLFPDVRFADATVSREYFPGIIAFEILYSLLLTLILGKWAGISTFSGGLKTGALVGLLLGLCSGLWDYSVTTVFESGVIWWSAVTWTVRFGVAGGLIGWVLGRQ